MSDNKKIQLGLCCLNSTMRKLKPPVFSSRKMIIRTIKEQGVDALKAKITQNLKDTLTLIDWNEANGIKVFRLSSELFPHKSNPKVEDYDFDFARDLLKKIGDKAKKYNQRLTFHPGQYNVIGTPNIKAYKQTICDLTYHATVLDLMGMDENSVMVVPVVFDTHHFECYKQLHPNEEFKPARVYMPYILDTWKRRSIKPKFHVSEQGSGRCGHHSDYIETIPDYLLEIPDKYGVDIDIMIEAKKKELAIFKLYEKYPFLNCKRSSNSSNNL